jgi:hypothetical protein
VAERLTAHDVVLFQIPYGRYAFDYYYESPPTGPTVKGEHRLFLPWVLGGGGEPYQWVEGLYTNSGMSMEVVDRLMRDLLVDAEAVWMVKTEVEMWDEREMAQAWLAEHATLVDEVIFVRVEVLRYELEH